MMEGLLHGCSIDGSIVGTNEGSGDAEDEKSVVQHLAGSVLFPPEQHQVHQGRHDEGKERAAAGSHEGHQLTKVRNSDNDQPGEENHEQPQHLGLQSTRGDLQLLL